MTYAYRFVIDGTGIDFVAPGELQKAAGCYMVVAEVGYDQAKALVENGSRQRPVTLWVEVDGRGVAFMHVQKCRMQDKRGQHVQIAALVHVPDPFAGAGRA